jgi:hypothetical protein
MNCLVACEESQTITIELRKLGHYAFSCDLQDCSGGFPEWHIKGDCLEIINGHTSFYTSDSKYHKINDCFDLVIAHPPCTYLSNAGARHLYKGHVLNHDRYLKGINAKLFFMKIYNSNCEHICIENPVPSKIYNLPKYSQIIQPFEFGDIYSKRTCLWLKQLPLLISTYSVEPIATLCPSSSYKYNHDIKYKGVFTSDRAKLRSKTFHGIAQAMAFQFTNNFFL